jgi:hypothetical protein
VYLCPADQEEASSDWVASGGRSQDGGEAGWQRGRAAGLPPAGAVVDPRLRCEGSGGGELQSVSVGGGEQQRGRRLELGWWRAEGRASSRFLEQQGCRISIH